MALTQQRIAQALHRSPAVLRPPQRQRHAWRQRRWAAAEGRGQGASPAPEELSVDIPTADARSCIRFKVVPTGPAQQAILVDAVADGSSAAQAGVQRGMKLTGISDPVRRNEVWQLQDRPSLRYVRDVLRMRSSPAIELRFAPPSQELLDALDASDGALRLASGSSSADEAAGSAAAAGSSAGYQSGSDSAGSLVSLASMSVSDDEAGGTVAERLQQQFEQKQQASPAVAAYNQRQQRRKEYMEQVGQRKDNTFLVLLGASFLLPALVILAVAWGSGYLDALYSNTMTNMR